MKLNIKYSPEKDTETYIKYVYNFRGYAHGRHSPNKKILERLEPSLQKILKSSGGEETAHDKVLEYLKAKNAKNPNLMKGSILNLKNYWEQVGDSIIKFLEFLYQKPFPFEEVTLFMTTNHIFPYSYKQRYFFANYKYTSQQIETIKHELNHFMFYYYYSDLKEDLGDEKFELLKESITFFSNPEQRGKPNEKPLRNLYRSKNFKSLEEAIKAGTKILQK